MVLSESERSKLVKKWAAWLAGKDIERGLKVRICFLFLVPITQYTRNACWRWGGAFDY